MAGRQDPGAWPSIGADAIAREGLLGVLDSADVATVFAPLGFGKTTLLVQHAQRQDTPVLWVTLDRHDDDAVLCITKLVATLERVTPPDRGLRRALAAPGASVWARLVPRLMAALAAIGPSLLVFDDLHEVTSQEVVDVLTWIALQARPGSQVLLAGRSESGSHLARLRVGRDVVEIGAGELAFSEHEALQLLRASGVDVSPAIASEINDQCEGWPAGLRLAALSCIRDGTDARSAALAGSDRLVTDYVRTELLASLSSEQASFMLQASLLHRMSPALCDFVLRRSGSGAMLRDLERSNAFVAAIDRDERWYRFHDLVRESLEAELERQDPALPRLLQERAAEWHAANQMQVEAVHYRQDAGDDAATVRMMAACAQEQFGRGRTVTILGWLRWAEERDLLGVDPALAMSGALVFALHGDPERATRFADVLYKMKGGDQHGVDEIALRGWQATIRAYSCERGVSEAISDGELACSLISLTDRWRRPACFALGLAHVMNGDEESAERVLSEIAGEQLIEGAAPNARAAALGLRAGFALQHGDLDRARSLLASASEIRRLGALEGQGPQALQDALLARVAVAEGRVEDAATHLRQAQKLRSLLNWAMPGLATITRIELARAHLSLADAAGARTLILEIQDILHRRPRQGQLVDEVDLIRRQLAEVHGGTVGASTLTGAELRLVPMLATHLTFAEVGSRLSVSENTIKTQAMSVYRKLDATSRGEAVAHAIRAGLIDPAAVSAIVFADD